MSALLLSLTLTAASGATPPPPPAVPLAPAVYVAIGDSTGAGMGAVRGGGYPERLAERLRRAGLPVKLTNLCYPGARAGDALHHQLPRALAAQPRLVTVAIGINDVLHGTRLSGYRQNLDQLVRSLQGSGARVVLVNVPDLALSPRVVAAEPPAEVRARVELVNQVVAETAARYQLELVDLFGKGAEVYGAPGTLAPDLLHPSDEGYERWAAVIEPAAKRALAPPQPQPQPQPRRERRPAGGAPR